MKMIEISVDDTAYSLHFSKGYFVLLRDTAPIFQDNNYEAVREKLLEVIGI